jgi:CBS domain-containing protein
MISNPAWRGAASDFARMVREWLMMPTPDSLMSLAIFVDAHAVCGDLSLLDTVQTSLHKLATDNDAMLARFASAIDAFPDSGGWWNRLLARGDAADDQLDIKKAGTFPLVHGIRAMALAQHLSETSTASRITALVAAGKLPADMGTDLIDSLHFFMGLKLKAGLAELAMDKPVTGTLVVAKLSSLDRDLLKDTLNVVKRFKLLMRQRFHLDAV